MFCKKRCCRAYREGDITSEELKNKINQGAILLDVRSKQEYQEGHLIGAINIPEYEIEKRVEKEISKKNQLIVVYCQYGTRSRNVYIKLRNKGYTNIYNLQGGLEEML